MTAADAFYGEPQAFDGTVFYQCLFSILRACGGEAARWWSEGTDTRLVERYGHQQQGSQNSAHDSVIRCKRLRTRAVTILEG